MVGRCPSAIIDLACRQEQLDWSCQWCLLRKIECPPPLGGKDVVVPRYPSHALSARLVECIRSWSFGILDRLVYPYRMGRLCNFNLDEYQHHCTNPELLLRILRCSTYNYVFWIHHCCHDASSEHGFVLPSVHLHPDWTLFPR